MVGSEYVVLAHAAMDPTRRRDLVSRVVVEDVQLRVSSFLREFSNEIKASSSGLVEALSLWTKTTGFYEEAIGLPIGLASFREPTVNRTYAAAASALHLNAAGRSGGWEATFELPVSLRWGAFVTPPLRRLVVCDDGVAQRLELCAVDGHESTVVLESMNRGGAPAGWHKLKAINILERCFFILDSAGQPFLPSPLPSLARSIEPTSRVATTLCDAISLIREYAVEYTSWVEDAIWGLIPVSLPTHNGYSSGSTTGFYGLIYQSHPVSPLIAAEGLIHEASHQHYHLAQLQTLFGNGQDSRRYWSPYPKMDRPIERILIAFHAFANVVFFYRACLSSGNSAESEHARHELDVHMSNLRLMSVALERSDGLTADGRAMFEGLRVSLFG